MSTATKRSGRMRLLRMVVVLTGLALLSRWLLLQSLIVPTDSMQPFLHGDPENGDRVLVFKPAYWWGTPQRFDAVAFRDPVYHKGGDLKYVVKRVVGFGGEWLEIRDGDIFLSQEEDTSPIRYCKSYEEFSNLLAPVWSGSLNAEHADQFWLHPKLAEIGPDDCRLVGAQNPEDGLSCRFQGAIDSGFVDASGLRTKGDAAVSDVVVSVTWIPENEKSGFVAKLSEGLEFFLFTLSPGRLGGKLEILHRTPDGLTYPTTASHSGFVPGVPSVVEFWNVDDVLGVALNGKVLLTTQHARAQRFLGDSPVDPAFGVFGGSATIKEVTVRRDLHYTTPSGQQRFQIRPNHLFVLGDYSEQSRDSRDFGSIPMSDLVGRPFAILFPFDRARVLD